MNKSLIKAAAVVNIALAAFAFVACSGDDGKDGKNGVDGTSCLVQPNVAGNFDIICGDAVIGQLTNGAPGPQGPQGIDGAFAGKGDPGEPGAAGISCSGAQEAASPANPYGGVRIVCGTQQFFVSNGAPGSGGGPSGDCNITAVTVPQTQDKGITISCTADPRSATILVCPAGSIAETGSTGLLLDDQGRAGKCLADGTISRTDVVVLTNVCDLALFEPKTHFCQRTISAPATANLGEFAVKNASGAVVKGPYPYGKVDITEPTSDYNSTNGTAGVTSVVLPLCGTYPATKDEDILTKHNTSTVYDANSYCGRNLVIKTGPGTTGRYGASDGADKNGRPISGSANDNDATQSYGDAWSVIAKGSCLINLLEAGGKINGYNYTSQANSDVISRACNWIEADSLDVPGASKYVFCPTDRPVVALDDIKCIARTGCIYHSTIDNTCLGQDTKVSTDGVQTGGNVVVPATIYSASSKTSSPSSWTYLVNKLQGSGIKNTNVGSRFGLGDKPNGFLSAGGNLWSKACVTQTRTVYYAVNDPYLSNKGFKEDPNTGSSTPGPNGEDYRIVQGPLCGGDVITVGSSSSVQTPEAFENAIACLNGQLSLDAKTANGQSIGYDGTTWDKPLFCVQSTYGLEAFCKITAPSIAEGGASYCDGLNGLDRFYETDGTTQVPNVTSLTDGTICKIITTTGPAITETICNSINSVARPRLQPIPASLSVVWNTTASLGSDHVSNAGGCVVSTTAYKQGSTTTNYLDNTDADTRAACTGINTASHGDGYIVPGTISASWASAVVPPAVGAGTCTGNTAHNNDQTACENEGTCDKFTSTAGDLDNDKAGCAAATGFTSSDWHADNTWNAATPTTTDVCKIVSDVPGAISANNCAWINYVAGSIPGATPVTGAATVWGSN